MRKKRVLIYNWIPFTDDRRGGGVRVYLKNLIDYIINAREDIDVTFLCSGVYCDEVNTNIRYEKISTYGEGKCDIFAIINSPIFAPAWLSFCRTEDVLQDQSTCSIFESFVENEGPFDVIHFHNVEGLSANVMDSKKKFPKTKFILSLHNYYCFCPEVNLWKEKQSICCKELETGRNCLDCMVTHVPAEKLRKKLSMTYELLTNDTSEKRKEFKEKGQQIDREYRAEEERQLSEVEKEKIVKSLNVFRGEMVKKINSYMDAVLCVSDRVKDIAFNMGIRSDLLRVSYIGTKAADNSFKYMRNLTKGEIVSLIFLGYQRKEKGFFFLVDALNALDKDTAGKIDLTIAALGNEETSKMWSLDYKKFHSYTFKNGYTKEEERELLRNKDLGIVPVLWEDNLPQVAIEMTAFGVPILCSDLGGAQELSDNPEFVFPAGNIDKFCERITYFVNNPDKLVSYYDNYIGLRTMEQHVDELSTIYNCEE